MSLKGVSVGVEMTVKTTNSIALSKQRVRSVAKAPGVIAKEHIEPCSILTVALDKQFLEKNRNEIFILSAKDALDADNKPLEEGYYAVNRQTGKLVRSSWEGVKDLNWTDRLFVSEEAAEIIKAAIASGEERLVPFVVDYGYGRGRCRLAVFSGIWSFGRARVAGKKLAEPSVPEIEVSHAEEEVKLAGITAERLVSLRRLSEQELSKVAEALGQDSVRETRKLIEALRKKE